MKLRKSLVAVLCAASLGAIAVPVTASADVGIYFSTAPPPGRYEVVPAPRKGYVWSSGYWNAHGNRHVWKAGHWEKQRKGYHWAPPTWTQHDKRWQLEQGRWNRGDRDGDGAPNARDRAPNDPNRR